MNILLYALGDISTVVAFACWVILIIGAFKNEVWQGLVGIIFPLYLVYFGLTEFDHPRRIPLSLTFLGSSLLSWLSFSLVR